MSALNSALIAKLGWKFLTNQDSLWVQQFRTKYIKYGDFFSTSSHSNASLIWKGILRSKALLSENVCLQVSRFSHFPIWATSWVPTLPSFKPLPSHPDNRCLPSLLISDLIQLDRCNGKLLSFGQYLIRFLLLLYWLSRFRQVQSLLISGHLLNQGTSLLIQLIYQSFS
ncbi:hypothetical protein SLA2020_282310 [Shorea laevis]